MSPPFLVRRARPSDLDCILAVEGAAFGRWAWDRNTFAEYARAGAPLFLVVTRRGRVVGYCIAATSGLLRRRAELVSIAVDAAVRGQGAADALMGVVLRAVRRRRIPRIGLMVRVTNERARAFYERYGFRKTRRVAGYYEDGEDGFYLRLDFPD